MKHLDFHTALFVMLTFFFLTSCDEEDDARLPSIQLTTAQNLTRCVDGKGWRHVESHEIKTDGGIDKHDYWSGTTGSSPVQYSFSGGELSTYMYIDAYPISGYSTARYTFDEGTNRLMAGGNEVFTVLSVTPDELRIIKYQATTGNGGRIYVYSVYRAMTPAELSTLKKDYPYNLGTLDRDYPVMPEQKRITADDFARYAVGSAWHCAEAHETFTAYRYAAAPYVADKSRPAVPDYEFTADTIYAVTPAADGTVSAPRAAAYTYRANGFYVETATGDVIKILSLTANEMITVQRLRPPSGGEHVSLYCVYRK